MHNSSLAIPRDTGQFPAAQLLKMSGSVALCVSILQNSILPRSPSLLSLHEHASWHGSCLSKTCAYGDCSLRNAQPALLNVGRKLEHNIWV